MTNIKKICFNTCAIFLIILSIMVIIFIDNDITKWIIAAIGFSLSIILLYIMNVKKTVFDPLMVKDKIRQFLQTNKLKLADRRGLADDKTGAGLIWNGGVDEASQKDDTIKEVDDMEQLFEAVVGSAVFDATEEIKSAISKYIDLLNDKSYLPRHELAKSLCVPILKQTKKLLPTEQETTKVKSTEKPGTFDTVPLISQYPEGIDNKTIISKHLVNDERVQSLTVSNAKLIIPLINIDFKQDLPFIERDIFNNETMDLTDGILESKQFKLNTITNDYILDDKITSLTNLKHTIDFNWFHRMNSYIASLPPADIMTLRSYTKNGDVMVNTYLRGTLKASSYFKYLAQFYWKLENKMCPTFPQIATVIKRHRNSMSDILLPVDKITVPDHFGFDGVTPIEVIPLETILDKFCTLPNLQDIYRLMPKLCEYAPFNKQFVKEVIEQYNDDLNRIIENSPALEQAMVVYRGVKKAFIPPSEGKLYNNCGFLSTSFNKNISDDFSGRYESSVIQEIVLLPGAKGILLSSVSEFKAEAEILLGSNTIYYIHDCKGKNYKFARSKIPKLHLSDESHLDEMCIMTDDESAPGIYQTVCKYIVIPH